MTNLGSLTSTFTPATGCNSVIWGYVHTETNKHNASDSTTYKYHSLGLTSTSACFPPAFFPSYQAFYSPGLCPSDWVSACGSIEIIGTVTETRATCCPRGYTCIGAAAAETAWSTLSCSSVAISAVSVTVPDESNQNSRVVELQGPLIFAAAVNVRWQKGDFAPAAATAVATTAASSARISAADGASSSGPTLSGTAPPETSRSDPPGGPARQGLLSTGSKIGIGVGVGVGALLLGAVFAIVLLWLRRRKRQPADVAETQDTEEGLPKPAASEGETAAYRHGAAGATQEMWSPERKTELQTCSNTPEVHGHARPAEVHGYARAAELPGA